MRNNKTSQFIALILRHKPETIGITLDEHGWANVQELIDGINATGKHHLDMELLEEIVRLDEKQRYSFNEDRTLITIDEQGLIPKSRLYVHMSADKETAKTVGSRHGRPVIYEIDCKSMSEDGYRFYLSENHVWLTKAVPAKYLKKLP